MTVNESRRRCIAGLASFGAALLGGCSARSNVPKTFVLVHGAWHGSWAWEMVKPLLEREGARVFAPTLTGLAERQDENGPAITLDTHIADVLTLIREAHLGDIVLVGHSYAGFVITGVCDRSPEKIAHAVYLDAFVPESGQKVYDYVTPAERVRRTRDETLHRGQGYKAFPPAAENWGLTGELMTSVDRRMTPHPAMANEQPLILKRGGPYAVPRRTYIDCTAPAMPPFISTKSRIRQDARWNYISLPAGHEVTLTHPQLVADTLAHLA